MNVGYGIGAEDPGERPLERGFIVVHRLLGVVDHGACGGEFSPGERQVVDLHLHLVDVPAREMCPAPLKQCHRGVDDASCSIHLFPAHRQQCCNGRFYRQGVKTPRGSQHMPTASSP